MLLLSRKNHQGLVIEPDASVPLDMKVTDLFGETGIRIKVIDVEQGVVKLGIDAPDDFKILRDELNNWNELPDQQPQKSKPGGANIYRRRRSSPQ
ncbi:hypothetical protein MNBD_GAMMA12-3422 [hydrothermal vent metagenome]|uniref:Carbon storage regulator n=1 Tax=hydrothermal vent metagenome TaxID=652676 RepID=A0A3B0YYN4_9ZZZZ